MEEVITVDDIKRLVDDARYACEWILKLYVGSEPKLRVLGRGITALSNLAMREHKEKEFWKKEYRELVEAIHKAEQEGGEI